MALGKNTLESSKLRVVVEEIEVIEAEMKDLRDKKSAVMARAKSEGFTPAGISYVIKARAMKPHDRQEAETIRDIYMHAMGMDEEPPLFRALAAMAEDDIGREKLIENLKSMCPPKGDFIVRVGGEPVRIFRDRDGNPQVEPYSDKPGAPGAAPAKPSSVSGRTQREVPNVDEDGAFEFGKQMYRDNKPITENPFPFGDPRRAKCDEGFRKESGGDGMGPDD